MIDEVRAELRKYATPENARVLQWFFKTGPGEYGEGDVFLGVKVPPVRKTAAKFISLPLTDVRKLLSSVYHEERLLALLILIKQFNKADEEGRKKIIDFYFKYRKFVNNWDLVDLSAPYLSGQYYYDKDRSVLYDFVINGSMWEKRIGVLSSFFFIKQGDFATTLEFVHILMDDRRDLINKACGWMLREIGKRDMEVEEDFLKIHYRNMPRTMLRYAIEKFPEQKRLAYLKGNI